MNRKLKRNEKIVGVIAIFIVALALNSYFHILSIGGSCSLLPSQIFSGTYSSSGSSGLVINSCSFSSTNLGVPVLYQYSLTQGTVTSWAGLMTQSSPAEFLISANQSFASAANQYDEAQITNLTGEINNYQSQLTNDENTGSCGYNGYTCASFSTDISNLNTLIQILNNSIAYDNAKMSVSTSTTSTTATTTGSSSTTTASGVSTSPPNPIINGITTGLSNIVHGFLLSLQSFWTQYFNVPQGLFTFSIAATNVSSTNVTTLGSQVTGTVSLSIPSSDTSTVWSPSVTYVVRTYCQAAMDYNSTPALFENSSIVNMSTTSFTYTFPVKANQEGVIVFGGICETTNSTYSLTSGTWSAWTPFKNVTVEHYAIYVAGNQTLTTGVTPVGSGIVVPPTGAHTYGSQVILGEQASNGYAFLKWQGTGRGNYTGTIVNPTVTMNNNITETAVFQVSTSPPPVNSNPTPLSAQWFANIWNSFTSWLAGLRL